MKELDIIETLAGNLARSPAQRNARFEADAELVETDYGLLALTVDEFSAEDLLCEGQPRLLGWNLVCATLSDLLAVGARPAFMLNSLVAGKSTGSEWIGDFAAGAGEALESFGAFMLGGDSGTGPTWRFTGVGMGFFDGGRSPRGRKVAVEAGAVLVSGALGDANLAAAGLCPPPRFEPRTEEAAALGGGEVACIDTSDGFASALEAVLRLNPGLRVEVELDALPLAAGAARAAVRARIPPEALLLGSAGEYELVALVSETRADELMAQKLFRRVGSFRRGPDGGLFYRRGAGGSAIAHRPLPDPRGSGSVDRYRRQVIALARSMFGAGGEG
jgi:thiamine-monophosphate kinase